MSINPLPLVKKLWSEEPVRLAVDGALAAVVGVLAVKFGIDGNTTDLIDAGIAVVLGVSGAEVARSQVSSPATLAAKLAAAAAEKVVGK
ncbi:hypothetical protein [Nocardia jiangxiensis]|uniref:hypothetical protein n=1 Tax=Nocardia jiangxiensis TaxID=282685 RepID=UPI0002DCBFB2|nr:hypothetical protein [Nocardia jiangxiensis]